MNTIGLAKYSGEPSRVSVHVTIDNPHGSVPTCLIEAIARSPGLEKEESLKPTGEFKVRFSSTTTHYSRVWKS